MALAYLILLNTVNEDSFLFRKYSFMVKLITILNFILTLMNNKELIVLE